MAWTEHGLQISLRTYTLLMEDTMAAWAFGHAWNYEWDSSFNTNSNSNKTTTTTTLVLLFTIIINLVSLSTKINSETIKNICRNGVKPSTSGEIRNILLVSQHVNFLWGFCCVSRSIPSFDTRKLFLWCFPWSYSRLNSLLNQPLTFKLQPLSFTVWQKSLVTI